MRSSWKWELVSWSPIDYGRFLTCGVQFTAGVTNFLPQARLRYHRNRLIPAHEIAGFDENLSNPAGTRCTDVRDSAAPYEEPLAGNSRRQ